MGETSSLDKKVYPKGQRQATRNGRQELPFCLNVRSETVETQLGINLTPDYDYRRPTPITVKGKGQR